MPENRPDLEELRSRIDEIDDRLHELLIERIGIVSQVAAYKNTSGGVAPHQPACWVIGCGSATYWSPVSA